MAEYGLVWEKREEEMERILKEKRVVLKEREDLFIKGGMWSPEHRIIEGDNLASMTYLKEKGEKADVIFCDPPYNTMTSLTYNDGRKNKEDEYEFSEWLNFMDVRMRLVYDLLSDDGVVYVTIDDRMVFHMKLIMDSIFGYNNFVCNLIWRKRTAPTYQTSNNLSVNHEYILMYSKDKSKIKFKVGNVSELSIVRDYVYEDERGIYRLRRFKCRGKRTKNNNYEVTTPNGHIFKGTWELSESTYKEFKAEGRIHWGEDDGKRAPSRKMYLDEVKGLPMGTILDSRDVGFTATGTVELGGILGDNGIFDYPKPSKLFKYLLGRVDYKRDLTVLDVFAGSGTTGHAVLDFNNENEYINKFILLNIDEGVDGEGNICEDVTYKRLKNLMTGYRNSSGKYVKKKTGKLRYYVVDLEDRVGIEKD